MGIIHDMIIVTEDFNFMDNKTNQPQVPGVPAPPPPAPPLTVTPPPPQPPPTEKKVPNVVSQTAPEVVVVPAASAPNSAPVPEPIVPTPVPITPERQYVNPPAGNFVPPPAPSADRGSAVKKILMIFLVFILIGGFGGGGWYAMKLMNANKTVTITYWGLWENESVIKPVIDEFEAQNPKIKVQYVKQSHKQYRERLASAIDRNEGPDVFRFHNTWLAMLKNQIRPVPSDIISPDEFGKTFYPVAKNDLIAGSTIYGIPLMIDGLGLYINDDLFATAGVGIPVTWEDIINIVPVLTVYAADGSITTSAIALGTINNIENWSDILATMMMQNGTNLVNPTGQVAEETFIFYRKFSDSSDPLYTWSGSMDNSIYAFATGKVAMIMAPSWRAFDVKEISPDLNFRIVPIPQLPGNTVNWASYWVEGLSSKSAYPEQSAAFLKFLTSKESAQKLFSEASKNRLFGEPYARTDLASSVAGDQYVEAYVKQGENAKSFPLSSRTHDNGLNDQMIKYLENAYNEYNQGGGSPAQTLETAAAGFSQVLSKYGLISSAQQ